MTFTLVRTCILILLLVITPTGLAGARPGVDTSSSGNSAKLDRILMLLKEARELKRIAYAERAEWNKQKKQYANEISELETANTLVEKEVEKLEVKGNLLESDRKKMLSKLDERHKRLSVYCRILVRMKDDMKKFVETGLPWNMEKRLQRVDELIIPDHDKPAEFGLASALRALSSAIEEELSLASVVAFRKDTVHIAAEGKSVRGYALKVGGIGMVFISIDGEVAAYWEPAAASWKLLDPGKFENDLKRAIEILSRKRVPEIIEIPVPVSSKAESGK